MLSIMRLNAITRDHFENPRNAGPLADPTHEARATNPICGDFLTLQLRLAGDVIQAAHFQAEGCAPTYAAASILTERITGQTAGWARSVGASDIIGWLGGVPPGKEHAAALAAAVLHDALRLH